MSAQLLHSVYQYYQTLSCTIPLDSEIVLGGKLLYAGDISNKSLLYAANIAGAASIAASADPALQRQAIRDGVIDFLVNSLEEALRILKNEIRKHQAVSVGVSIAPSVLTQQMLDRGVLPDLLAPKTSVPDIDPDQEARFLSQGALRITNQNPSPETFVTWGIEKNVARTMPQLDSFARLLIPDTDWLRHRWLRLAPRYLGRAAQRLHGVPFSEEEFTKFKASIAAWAGEALFETGQSQEPSSEVKIEISTHI